MFGRFFKLISHPIGAILLGAVGLAFALGGDSLPEGLLIDGLVLVVGVLLLVRGGDLLVEGAVTIAQRLGVSPLLIGLTIVAFGTSAPELALNMIAAFRGNDGLSFGNIIGSNIANIGLILGIAALIHPLQVHTQVIKRELPIMLAATVLTVVLAVIPLPTSIDTSPAGGFQRFDGGILLTGFAMCIGYMLLVARRDRAMAREFEREARIEASGSLFFAILRFVFGLLMLVLGGQLGESGASGLARGFGISDEVIGLTIVALATSLPELVTSLMAVRRGHIDIAVGNVVGSNVFNLLLVMGATSVISSVDLTPNPFYGAWVSLAVMLLLSFLLVPMSRTHGQVVSRVEGAVLLGLYVAYIVYEVILATSHRIV